VVTQRTEDNFVATFDLAGSDALVSVSGCRATSGRSGLIDAACRDAQVVADHQQHVAHRIRGLERTPIDLPPAAPTVRATLESFAALLQTGTAPPTTLTDGVSSVMIAEACLRSAAENRAVDVPAVLP
jgi:predicted dehydrogenase